MDGFWHGLVEGYSAMELSLAAAATVGGVYCVYSMFPDTFLKAQGLPGPTPLPFFGNALPVMIKGRVQADQEHLRKYGRIHGAFLGRTQYLVVADPDLLQTVMVKEFSSFMDRPLSGSGDALFDNSLMGLRGSKWRFVRQALTPTFSPAKLKQMSHQINECARLFASNLEKHCLNQQSFELKQYTGNYTMDVIASTAFGLQVDSQTDSKNAFVYHAKNAFGALRFSNPVFLIMIFAPILLPLVRLFQIRMLPADSCKFFTDVVAEAVHQRTQVKPEGRVDLLQMMINAHHEEHQEQKEGGGDEEEDEQDSFEYWKQKGMTEDLIASQALIFFLGGYDSTASTIAFLGYELALNPDCQDRLIAEVDSFTNGDNDFDCDTIAQMTYMDMCVQEALRKYPPFPRSSRSVKNDITIHGIHLKKGMRLSIPIYAIHHDPEFWPDPDKFDPERFTAEAKSIRHPYTYLPFLLGPRNCIGMRLAILEAKVAIAHVLRRFKFVPCEETQVPLKFKRQALLTTQKGFQLKLEKRISS